MNGGRPDTICEQCGGVLKWWDWLFNRHICRAVEPELSEETPNEVE
ncbi:hypothetical protein LCGC14_1320300 [marine sediment metagenome]|uniref:Uncharacterized protein n=1 Tax=marine sediment metagenome TaxID=412755 RepID=A0A0F9KJT3_9ZZZZ